jgi:Helix-turn-helix domain
MTDDRKGKGNWVALRFEWMRVVAAEIHEWLTLAVAVQLAGRYLNSKTKDAWMSADTLAAELNTDRRSVQRAFDKLVEVELLKCERGGRGGRNYYWIPKRLISGLRTALRERAGTPKGAGWDPPEKRAGTRQRSGLGPALVPRVNPRGFRERVASRTLPLAQILFQLGRRSVPPLTCALAELSSLKPGLSATPN